MTAQRYNFFLKPATHNTKKDDDVYEVKTESRKKNWFCVKPFATTNGRRKSWKPV